MKKDKPKTLTTQMLSGDTAKASIMRMLEETSQ